MYSKDIYRVNEEEGVPASRNLGGSGVVKFSKPLEVFGQRQSHYKSIKKLARWKY